MLFFTIQQGPVDFEGLKRSTTGFTLIELLIVIAAGFGLAAFFLAPFQTLRERSALDGGVEQVVGALEEARAFTLSSKNGLEQGVHIATSTITMFPGTAYVSGGASNIVTQLSSLIALTSTTSADILFKKGSGKTDQQHILTITLVTDAAQKRTITVYATGAIKTQ